MKFAAPLMVALTLVACAPGTTTPTPSTSSSPNAPGASPTASASAPASAAPGTPVPVQGGSFRVTFTMVQTPELTEGTVYDAETIFVHPLQSQRSLSFGKTRPQRNFTAMFTNNEPPKVGDVHYLGNSATGTQLRGYFQYAQDSKVDGPPTYLWLAASGTLTIDSLEGKAGTFTIKDALMQPQKAGNNPVPGGSFVVNGTGRVDTFPGL